MTTSSKQLFHAVEGTKFKYRGLDVTLPFDCLLSNNGGVGSYFTGTAGNCTVDKTTIIFAIDGLLKDLEKQVKFIHDNEGYPLVTLNVGSPVFLSNEPNSIMYKTSREYQVVLFHDQKPENVPVKGDGYITIHSGEHVYTILQFWSHADHLYNDFRPQSDAVDDMARQFSCLL